VTDSLHSRHSMFILAARHLPQATCRAGTVDLCSECECSLSAPVDGSSAAAAAEAPVLCSTWGCSLSLFAFVDDAPVSLPSSAETATDKKNNSRRAETAREFMVPPDTMVMRIGILGTVAAKFFYSAMVGVVWTVVSPGIGRRARSGVHGGGYAVPGATMPAWIASHGEFNTRRDRTSSTE